MASCKDCIHYCRCKDTVADENWNEDVAQIIKDMYSPIGCVDFKNKADVVEVVRCKDCKHYEANGFVYEEGCGRCDHPRQQWEVECYDQWVETRPNDFCSYGERRETNAE